jgi:hypothetical protein
MYDNRLRQLPDFDMWVRLLKKYDIHVSEKEMIAFRQLPGANASSATAVNLRRLMNEAYFILQRFFEGISSDVFLDGFGDLMVKPAPADDASIEIEQSLLYLAKDRWASHIYNLIGLEKLHHLLKSDTHRQILIDRYGIDDRTFHSIAAETDALDMTSTALLSNVNGLSLIAEVKRRLMMRTPSILLPALNSIFKRF